MEIIDKNLQVSLGQLIRVKNTDPKLLENGTYVAVQVEDEDGDNERCILFTEKEIANAKRLSSNIFNNVQPGRLYDFLYGLQLFKVMKVISVIGNSYVIKVPNSLLSKAERRASRNPEDLTKKGFFINLFD